MADFNDNELPSRLPQDLWLQIYEVDKGDAVRAVHGRLRLAAFEITRRDDNFKLASLVGPDGAALIARFDYLKTQKEFFPEGLDFDFEQPVLKQEERQDGKKTFALIKIKIGDNLFGIELHNESVDIVGLPGGASKSIPRGKSAIQPAASPSGNGQGHESVKPLNPVIELARDRLAKDDPRLKWIDEVTDLVIRIATGLYEHKLKTEAGPVLPIRQPDAAHHGLHPS